jgi:subtilisin family serine protease
MDYCNNYSVNYIHCYGDWKFSVPKKPNDPLFSKQWYLHNKKYPGEDINWVPVYNAGITGKDVRITIVGDGFDTEHPDA